MGVGKLNIWVSDVAEPCGTWAGGGQVTVFECDGILEWPCGRYMAPDGTWKPVPNGTYKNLPFKCGHIQVEVPPGCYWVIAGYVTPGPGFVHLNYTTHVGITQVGCDETACVKLYNPTIRLCWNWFLVGIRMLATRGQAKAEDVRQIEAAGEKLLQQVPHQPIESIVEKLFVELVEAGKQEKS